MNSPAVSKAFLPVLLISLLFGGVIGLSSSPVLAAGLVITSLLAIAALRFPYEVAAVALAIGALLPEYIGYKSAWLPITLNGPFAVAVMLGVCAAAVSASQPRREGRRGLLLVPGIFALLWLGGSFFAAQGSLPSRLGQALAVSSVGAIAVVSIGTLALSQRGRTAVAGGIAAGGLLAATYGAMEMLVWRDNPLLQLGIGLDPAYSAYREPLRFGFRRISATFTHPIMFSIFLGLAIICVIGLNRAGRVPLLPTVAAVSFLALVDVATLSRAPLLACAAVCVVWLLVSSSLSRAAKTGSLLVALALAILGVRYAAGSTSLTALLDPNSGSEIGNSILYRIRLSQALVAEFRHAPWFGFPGIAVNPFLSGFDSLDNQVAYLLRSRGFVGLFAFGLLGLAPIVSAVRARRWGPQIAFGLSITAFLLFVSLTVAIFGSVQLYVLGGFSLALALVAEGPSARESRSGLG